jgi:hypothetical protein
MMGWMAIFFREAGQWPSATGFEAWASPTMTARVEKGKNGILWKGSGEISFPPGWRFS